MTIHSRELHLRRFLLLPALLFVFHALSPAVHAQKPLLSFGVFSDVQWADRDAEGSRDYRGSRDRFRQIVAALNIERVAFSVQLGDFIDGWDTDSVRSGRDLDSVLRVSKAFKGKLMHVAGNHDHRAGANILRKKWKLKSLYYDFAIPASKGWRFVVLDANDGAGATIGEKQLAWFSKTLSTAKKKRERVIVFCHYPLLREAAPNHRLDNPEPILSMLDSAACVVAWIAGHDHAGGYTEYKGVHHITLRAVVEYPQKTPFAVVNLYADKLVELGFGAEQVRVCPIKDR